MANSKYEYVKAFESHTPLLPQCYMVVRLDGRGFHKFTQRYDFCKPNDPLALQVMNKAAAYTMGLFPDCVLAYGDSDEYSFLLRPETVLFNRREDKIVSTFVSTFTAAYMHYWGLYSGAEQDIAQIVPLPHRQQYRNILPAISLSLLPTFDGRVVLYPSLQCVKDYFRWRQVDCHINNLYNTSFWTLVQSGLSPQAAEQKLMGTLAKDKHDILFHLGVNYNNEPEMFKKGSTLVRRKGKVTVVHEDMVKSDQFWIAHGLN